MAYTFMGQTFGLATPDGFVNRFIRTLNHNIEHIPYSGRDVVDIGGRGIAQVKGTMIILTSANATDMQRKLGNTGALVYGSIFSGSATLLTLDNERCNYDQTHYWFDFVFIKDVPLP